MTKTIKIKDTDYVLRPSRRALLKFEDMTGRSVMNIRENLTDETIMFYAILYGANHKTFQYDFDEFQDILDEDDTLDEIFTEYMTGLVKGNETTDEEKKKM